MVILKSIDSLLEHIKLVQEDVVALSNESLMKMSSYIERNNLEIDDDISTALQYQDIITQQLNATIDAINSVKGSIDRFTHAYENDESLVQESMNKLYDKLDKALSEAKDKKERFSGKTAHGNAADEEEIEFF